MRTTEPAGSRLVALLALALCACSAIIEPDPSRLGGDDAGRQQGRDGGGADGGDCPASCDDGVACTVDGCAGGACASVPDDGACGAGERCSPVLGCVPERCTRDEECDDGVFCNGVERCQVGGPGTGCVPGEPPACDDGASCTNDRCDEAGDRCVSEPNHAACADAFECTIDRCDPEASDAATGCVHAPDDSVCATGFCHTGATCDPSAGCVGGTARDCSDSSPCTTDACDESSAMCTHVPRDDDGDGAPAMFVSGAGPAVLCPGGTDCDDTNASVHPGAMEVCGNGTDDDCDGTADEGCARLPDDCSSAQTIDLRSTATGSASGTFASFSHDYQTSVLCGAASGGRDAVYAVVLPRGTFDVTIDTIGSTADTVLGVGFDCSMTGFQAACNDDYAGASVSNASRIWLHRFGSAFSETTFYVLVDAFNASTTGGFQLNVQRTAARNDSCPSSLTGPAFDMSGGGTLVGVQTSFTSATRGSCQPFVDTSPEAVLYFEGAPTGVADFEVYSADFVPVLYLRHDRCSSGTEVECVVGSSIGGGVNRATMRESVTAGDDYFLFVDGGRTYYVVYYQPF